MEITYMKLFRYAILCFSVLFIMSAMAQTPYGIGDNVVVPYVAPGTISLDGVLDEAAWDDAAVVDIMAYWEGAWSGHPEPDVMATAKLLWTEDTLFVSVLIEDYQEFFFGPESNPWWGEQILIGIDRSLANTRQVDDSWSGFADNLPHDGAVVYKIYDKGITFNWNFNEVSPIDSGWVDGTVFVDDDNFEWGVEMKFWVPQIRNNSMIGFNIAGATATPDTTFQNEMGGEGAYAYFCWHPQPADTAKGYPADYLAGDIMRRAQSFGTLTFTGGPRAYGIDDDILVPYVAPNVITIDGSADETAWDDAASVDIMAYWEGAWSGHPDPDVDATAKLLWTDGALYAYVAIEDYQPFFFGPESNPWWGEQILLGVDGRMWGTEAEDGWTYDGSWGGGTWNMPDLGPTVYKIFDQGITANWNFDGIFPVDSGYVEGVVFVNDDEFVWGVEMKINLPQVALGSKIGFNIAGATATPDTTFQNEMGGEGAYAYFAWHPQPSDTEVGYPADYLAGDIMRRVAFGTVSFVDAVTKVAEPRPDRTIPTDYVLLQNYPNPFNPETRILFSLPRNAHVNLSVFNVLGQHVATLVDGEHTQGAYEATWSATGFSSGIYFYRLQIDNQIVDTKRMVLLK
jgi:hypothetical protein